MKKDYDDALAYRGELVGEHAMLYSIENGRIAAKRIFLMTQDSEPLVRGERTP